MTTVMLMDLHCNRFSFFATVWQWLLLLLIFKLTYSQEIFTTQIILSTPGMQFIPVNIPAQLISTTLTDSVKNCIILCNKNFLCRVFDYEVFLFKQCRLFEGDTSTLGKIVSSSSPQSRVGTVQLSPDLFAEYGSPCSTICYHSRYLQCSIDFICECMPHTYWNASSATCLAQSPILGASCRQNMSMCREDINYTCLQFNQCGPLSVLSGTTVADSSTIIGGSSTVGISNPYGIAAFGTDIDSVIIVDINNNRIVGLWDASASYENISVVATEWAPGQPLCLPFDVYVDVRNGYDLYVSDYCNPQVVLYSNMQTSNPLPRMVAGTGGGGVGPENLNVPFGVQVDSHNNVIVADMGNNRIMFWPPNATTSTMIAGSITGINSMTSMGLDNPTGIALDERNSWLYVADYNNHRIQRYSLNDTWPCNGTTVAGGNGPGADSNQLSYPIYIRISNKTGALYIVDCGNSRIQRWEQGATEGVTIAGDPNGNLGTNDTMFLFPTGLAINANETLMYVADTYNNRIQRFQLI